MTGYNVPKKGWVVVGRDGRVIGGSDARNVFNSKASAEHKKEAIIRNNSLKERRMVGAINMKVKHIDLYATGDPQGTFFK